MEIINNNTNFSSQFWLIEMNGGPETDCVGKEVDDCPNYTFEDIAYAHFPASIGAVQYFSGKEQVNYVGHSNGCRITLTSLSKHYQGENNIGYVFENGEWILTDLVANPVDKFFGIACPTTLNDETSSSDKLRKFENGNFRGNVAINTLENYSNIYQEQFVELVTKIPGAGSEVSKISLNLQDFYNDLYLDLNSQFTVDENLANIFFLFAGTDEMYPEFPFINPSSNGLHDGVVPVSDLEDLDSNLINSVLYYRNKHHSNIIYDDFTKSIIEGVLE